MQFRMSARPRDRGFSRQGIQRALNMTHSAVATKATILEASRTGVSGRFFEHHEHGWEFL